MSRLGGDRLGDRAIFLAWGLLNMLDKSFIEAITALTQKAQNPLIAMAPDSEPRGVYYVRQAHGEYQRTRGLRPPMNHQVHDLVGFVGFVQDWAGGHSETADKQEAPYSPVVWVSLNALVLKPCQGEVDHVPDTDGDTITYRLGLSTAFQTLQGLQQGMPKMSQADLIRLLRVPLNQAAMVPEAFLGMCRSVNFKVVQETASELHAQRVSLGKSIKSESTGMMGFPDEVTFHVPVLASIAFHWREPVRCAVEVHPAKEQFEIIPLPGELERAMEMTERALFTTVATALNDVENVLVCRGTPG